ncbi:MAG: glycosyltransferase, partial [Xanthomonadaceae bacterium]|nr:glycosyltransferase [Xanthomonadaceae bacterium]
MTKLSFCIATRNRADFIGETLASIATQCDGRGDEVEIIVLDGASTDNTAEVIGKLQSSFPFIHYFRQESN